MSEAGVMQSVRYCGALCCWDCFYPANSFKDITTGVLCDLPCGIRYQKISCATQWWKLHDLMFICLDMAPACDSGTLHPEIYCLPLPTFSLLLVTSHLVLEVFARQLLLSGISAAPAFWNSLPPTSILAKLSQHCTDALNLLFSIQPLPLPSNPSQCLWFVHDYGAL